ncbi:MAG: tRNA (adenosine(37)-N6)-threonylcarbamoyltransferase complex transferase subunit TsaD, partial [Christensenellales bacterium]
ANSFLRKEVDALCAGNGYKAYYPDLKLCTDNAAMIAAAAYYDVISGAAPAGLNLNAVPNLEI